MSKKLNVMNLKESAVVALGGYNVLLYERAEKMAPFIKAVEKAQGNLNEVETSRKVALKLGKTVQEVETLFPLAPAQDALTSAKTAKSAENKVWRDKETKAFAFIPDNMYSAAMEYKKSGNMKVYLDYVVDFLNELGITAENGWKSTATLGKILIAKCPTTKKSGGKTLEETGWYTSDIGPRVFKDMVVRNLLDCFINDNAVLKELPDHTLTKWDPVAEKEAWDAFKAERQASKPAKKAKKSAKKGAEKAPEKAEKAPVVPAQEKLKKDPANNAPEGQAILNRGRDYQAVRQAPAK